MRRRCRAPFVVTATVVGASVVGCSSASTSGAPNPPAADATIDSQTNADTIDEQTDLTPEGDAGDAMEANPPECPTDDPGIGARKSCDADASVRCTYPDLCPSHPGPYAWNVYACIDDGTGKHWTLVSDPYTPVCPKVQPNDGDPCPCTIHMAYAACNYGNCEDLTMVYAACKGDDTFDPIWHVTPITCNPPEPDAGFIDVTDDTAIDAAIDAAIEDSIDDAIDDDASSDTMGE